jgi:phosphoribosylformimino-5-aminoimidazole carboxamide ribotide isomerase
MQMMIIPAVDMLDGQVVQLVGGELGSEQVKIPDPFQTAASWVSKGAEYLHLVDLDAAFGKGNNLDSIEKIARDSGVPVEAGGGIRSEVTVDALVEGGVDRIVLGTKAIKEPEWLESMALKYPGRIALAMDTRGNRIVVKGWRESASVTVEQMFRIVEDLPLAAILNTNVDVEGQKKGVDEKQVRDFISSCPHSVIASGGVTQRRDAEILRDAGAVAAVVGLALYTFDIRPWEWDTPWRV